MKLEEKKPSSTQCCTPQSGCCSPSTNETQDVINQQEATPQVLRRDFIKTMGLGLGSLSLMSLNHPLSASGLFQDAYQIPINKNLDPEWIKSLYERGKPETYTGKDLVYIGMPVGGITAGQVYLGGDGKLWLWDIFNDTKEGVTSNVYFLKDRRVRARDGSNYIVPVTQEYPFDQGFSIKIIQNGKETVRPLDYKGFKDITFKGQYPIGNVSYKEEGLPLQVDLKAFSPFIPLKTNASNYPATVMQYNVTNASNETLSFELSGWIENPVLHITGTSKEVQLKNSIKSNNETTVLFCETKLEESNSDLNFNYKTQRDYGTMSLLVLGDGNQVKATASETDYQEPFVASSHKNKTTALGPFGYSLRGGLSKQETLAPGETKQVTFIVGWHFPNLSADGGRFKGRAYSNRFKNALQVVQEVAANINPLQEQTELFTDTFYNDSTLPYWFLNRTFANTSILATETCYQLGDGRFWAWEGIGCCAGTCTHVWHYAQAMGRVFPELERNLREQTDFAVIESDGKIDFRGGRANRDAADGQAGIVLRSFREHQMTSDNTFLNKNWKHIKLALQYLITMDAEDGEANGMIHGEQHNTLDAEWYGNIPVITSLYLAALKAGYEMATEVNDTTFAKQCKTILGKGQKNIETLFNGEYFIQKEDSNHKDAIGIGTGCYIDQVFGQSWAFQVGLGRLYNADMINKSLDALWKYNFVPHMGEFRKSHPEKLAGRPYAIDDDKGLVICTWPKGGKRDDWEKHWQFGYFNECMTGFEYEVAGHMIWEGKLKEGLAITRAIHDRYHAAKRNPYNEVECSDHYARAMASYGAYIAICGFEYHGPKKQIAFAPKITPHKFKAAFISANGWGSYEQEQEKKKQTAKLQVVSGDLALKQLTVEIPKGKNAKRIKLSINGKTVKNSHNQKGTKLEVNFKEINLEENQNIALQVSY